MIVTVIPLGHLKNSPFQFSIYSLLIVVTLVSIAVASDTWIMNSTQFASDDWFPVFFPPLGLLKFSVVGGPLLGIASVIAACLLWFRCRPIPYAPVLFLCSAPMVFAAPLSAAMRILTVLLLVNLCLFLEAASRKLPSVAVYASSCCLFTVFCYYMFVTSLFAGAFV